MLENIFRKLDPLILTSRNEVSPYLREINNLSDSISNKHLKNVLNKFQVLAILFAKTHDYCELEKALSKLLRDFKIQILMNKFNPESSQ